MPATFCDGSWVRYRIANLESQLNAIFLFQPGKLTGLGLAVGVSVVVIIITELTP